MEENKELTRDDIIKAFEHCFVNDEDCNTCPLNGRSHCIDMDNVNDVIHSLTGEIEKKDKYIAYLQRKLNQANVTYRRNL